MFEQGHLTDRRPPYRFAAFARVGFSETDAQGVVYYGRYMPYFDIARTEYRRLLRQHGLDSGRFAMRAMTVEYLAPARFDDLLEVFVRTSRIGRTSVTFDFEAYKVVEGQEDELLVTAEQTVVHLDLATRQTLVIPDDYRRRLTAFEETGRFDA